MYHVELVDNKLEVSVEELKITPEVNKKRLETLHALINKACQHKYIDLTNFQENT